MYTLLHSDDSAGNPNPAHSHTPLCRFSEWPNDALEAVALKFLKDVDVDATQRSQIMSMCKTFHESVRRLSEQYQREAGRINYVTPTSYLELITAFTTLLASKRAEVREGLQGRERGPLSHRRCPAAAFWDLQLNAAGTLQRLWYTKRHLVLSCALFPLCLPLSLSPS